VRVAAVQLGSGPDPDDNRRCAALGIERAVADGAGLVVLPELFTCLGPGAVLRANAEPLDGPTSRWASELAARHGIWLLAGSFLEQRAGGSPDGKPANGGDDAARPRLTNTSRLFGPDGSAAATYRKIHLFDVDVPGAAYRESALVEAGDEVVVAAVPPLTVGMSVCYDLRFPELYRLLTVSGATVLVVPAAFTSTTGPPHWEVLLRARAIENQAWVVAAGQVGDSGDSRQWHGASMVIDPWGTVVARAPSWEELVDRSGGHGGEMRVGDGMPVDRAGLVDVAAADIDLDELARVRAVLPSLANRRPDVYARGPVSPTAPAATGAPISS
jgi:predicted amidohydrolase